MLLNYSGDVHQSFSNRKNIPLTGGLFILIPIVFFLNDLLINSFIVSIYLVGFFSDRKILASPKKRFLIQCLLVLLFVVIFDVKINSSRIELFDVILNNKFFAIFFSTFCLLILINGSNFIDGLNGLLISSIIIILFMLTRLNLIDNSIISDQSINLIILILLLLLLLNIFNVLMLGDSGAYLLGFFIGFLIISSHRSNPDISPYFFISLIWYPCFENLFSILRKLNREFSPLKPDSKHLHQLVLFFLTKKFNLKLILANNLSSGIICFFNFLIMHISTLSPGSTIFQVKLIATSIIFYSVSYMLLFKFYKSNLISKK
jgi:UDP-N-acetylmuramyl pentapeptide phosphotransferase/UDP-N-acetylglucosamine-1-phosphate transferase